MRKNILYILSLLPLTLLLTGLDGCAGQGYNEIPFVEPVPSPAPVPEATKPTMPPMEDSLPGTEIVVPAERLIIRNGSISLVVNEVTEARDEIEEIALRLEGWVVSSNIYGEEENMRGNITIRIPNEQFDRTLSELRILAVRVTSETTNTQDVTEEYVDLQSRLANAEATEDQYLALLEQAKEIEDILNIYEALSGIRYDIEQLKGRIQYLEQTSAMSMISVDLTPALSLGPVVRPGWSANEALNSAIRGLTTFGQGLGTAFIWIGIFSPIWGTALGIAYWRHRRKGHQPKS